MVNTRILANKLDVVGTSVPLIYESDFTSSQKNGTTSQLIDDARKEIRTVVAVVREGESHVSGYLLDNDVFIDIYYKQFIYSYTNAIVDEDGILRVKHGEELPEIEVDKLPNSIKIVPSETNTGSSSLLKFYRTPSTDEELEAMIAMCALMFETWHTAPPLDFYNYEPACVIENQKVTTGLRYVLTKAGEQWIDQNSTRFPIPKPLSALHGIPVFYNESLLQNAKLCSRNELRLWDDHQISIQVRTEREDIQREQELKEREKEET